MPYASDEGLVESAFRAGQWAKPDERKRHHQLLLILPSGAPNPLTVPASLEREQRPGQSSFNCPLRALGCADGGTAGAAGGLVLPDIGQCPRVGGPAPASQPSRAPGQALNRCVRPRGKMSMIQAAAYVPEMILDAPKEVDKQDAARKVRSCVGVAFIKMIRAGCIVTIRGGSGIIMKKKEDGSFSAPCALTMLGPAIGASIGAEVVDFAVYFETEGAFSAFTQNVASFGLNGDLTAGVFGRQGEALITTGSKDGVTTFVSSKGLYGGVSLEISGIMVDKSVNTAQYGRPITPEEIFNTEPVPTGESFEKMYKALDDLTKTPLPEDTAEKPDEVAQQ
ncbi:SH3 domain-containing YSC84-like protein 1 [Durusdinium trenchii]|uniref:SH3 domain-containing YSC84-like protein 1 n=1 Tax=Durusdinium trenchii TaxID=1381693 RepID=A0ABP0K8V8_9DINO